MGLTAHRHAYPDRIKASPGHELVGERGAGMGIGTLGGLSRIACAGLGVPALVAADPENLVRTVGPAIQQLLAGGQ